MCANCVGRLDVAAGTIALGVVAFRDPARRALAAAGLVPDHHPRAADVRAVEFLRRLGLDPVPVLGSEVVEAADRTPTEALRPVYRRTFGEALALLFGRPIASQQT